MTVVIGNRLSDAPAGRPVSATGGGPDRAIGTTAGFGHVLDDAGKRQTRNPAGPAGEKPADKPTVMAGNVAFARMPAREAPPEGPQAGKGEHRPGKAHAGEATDGDGKSKDEETAGPADGSPAPLRDRTPLLAALNELSQRNGAGIAGPAARSQTAGTGAAPAPALAGTAQIAGAPGSATAAAAMTGRATLAPAPAAAMAEAVPDGTDGGDDARKTIRPGRPTKKAAVQEPEPAGRDPSDRRTANTVTVTHERSFPAPAGPTMSPAAARVVEALAAGARPVPQAPVPASPAPAAVALPTHMLKIELHPAELGVVTASLRLSGGQLSVELKPETAEAYRRLSADTDTIAGSLKKLGFDVDTVSVTQPAVAIHAAARADAGGPATAAMPGRDNPQFQSGTSGGGAGNSGGQQPGRNDGHEKTFERPAPAHRERAGGSLFI